MEQRDFKECRNEQMPLKILVLVIPFEETGALETFLLKLLVNRVNMIKYYLKKEMILWIPLIRIKISYISEIYY